MYCFQSVTNKAQYSQKGILVLPTEAEPMTFRLLISSDAQPLSYVSTVTRKSVSPIGQIDSLIIPTHIQHRREEKDKKDETVRAA